MPAAHPLSGRGPQQPELLLPGSSKAPHFLTGAQQRKRSSDSLFSVHQAWRRPAPRASKRVSLGSHFPNHRSDSSPAAVMKDLGPEWAGQPGRGHHYRIGSSCSSWAPPPASGQGDLQGRTDSTIQSNPIQSGGGPKQLLQLLRKGRLGIRDPSRRRRRRWWAGTRSPKLPPSKLGLGPGVNPLDSTRLFCPKVHGPLPPHEGNRIPLPH